MTEPKRTWSFFKKGKLLIADLLERARQALHNPVMESCMRHIQEGDAADRATRLKKAPAPLSFQSIETEFWLDNIIQMMAKNGMYQVTLEMLPFQDIEARTVVNTDKGQKNISLTNPLPSTRLYDLKEVLERRGVSEAVLHLWQGKEWVMQRVHTIETITGVYEGVNVHITEFMIFVQTKGFGWKAILTVVPRLFPEIRGGRHPSIPPSSSITN